MRLERMLIGVMTAGLLAGCDVARGAVYITTVSHYHGGASRTLPESPSPHQVDAEPETVRVPPRVPPNPID